MSSMSGSNAAPLHIVDIAGEIDPLAPLVIGDADAVWSRRLDRRVLQLRMSLDLRRRNTRHVVAWGERAYGVARAAKAGGIYRPLPGDRAPAPAAGWRIAAASRGELQRFAAAGWRELVIIPAPGVDLCARRGSALGLTRQALGIASDDYAWLLAGDASSDSGLRKAIWAGTVLHVLQRGTRRHRLLLWGDSAVHQRARRFASQLGQPELCIATTRFPYHAMAGLADAAVLLPEAAGATWSSAVVALAGIPAVINTTPEIQQMLGRRSNVRTAADDQPRSTVREMLRLSEDETPRVEPDPAYDPTVILSRWQALLGRPAGSRGETSPVRR